MWDFLLVLWDYWFLVLWAVAVVVAYVHGGKRLALLVLSLGFGAAAYLLGGKSARKEQKEIAHNIEVKREKAYEEITSRNTSRNDVIDRLRKRSY